MRRFPVRSLAVLLLPALWGCPPPGEDPPDWPAQEQNEPELEERGGEPTVPSAEAEMITAEGERAGIVTFAPAVEEEGVAVRGVVHVPGVPRGPRGFHVHEVGTCDPPDFESAGDHYAPHGNPHGGPDDPPEARHTGDLGNVEFRDDERAEIDLVDPVITVGEGEDDIVGRSLVIHSEEDDLTTQPDGDAGDRVACGVIERAETVPDDR